MLAMFILAAVTAMTPTSSSIAPIELPSVEGGTMRDALAISHNAAQRVVPFGGKRYLYFYPPRRDEVAGALMRGTNEMPYVISAAAAMPRRERLDSKALGQMIDAALLEGGKSFAVSAKALPVMHGGNDNAILFYDFGPDFEPNPTLGITLKDCVGSIAPGPAASVVALTGAGVTVLSHDGVVLGEVLKGAAGCSDRIAQIDAHRYAVFHAAKQQVTIFRLDVGKQAVPGRGPDWREADYEAAPVAKAEVEKTIDVSEAATGAVKAMRVDKSGNVFLVRDNAVYRYDGTNVQSWTEGRDWGAAYWDGDTLVALTRNAHWQRVKF